MEKGIQSPRLHLTDQSGQGAGWDGSPEPARPLPGWTRTASVRRTT